MLKFLFSGPPGELGEVGFQGEPGDSLGFLVMGEHGDPGFPGQKVIIYNVVIN